MSLVSVWNAPENLRKYLRQQDWVDTVLISVLVFQYRPQPQYLTGFKTWTSEVVGKWWWGYAFTGSFCCPANTHPFLKKWFDSKLLDSIEKGRERREWEGFRQSPVWVVRKNQMEILGVAREDGRTDHLTELVWPCVRCNWNLHFVAECLEWLPSIQEGMELLRRAPF